MYLTVEVYPNSYLLQLTELILNYQRTKGGRMTKYKQDYQKELLDELSDIEQIVQKEETGKYTNKIETFMTKLIRYLEKYEHEIEKSEAFKKLIELYNKDLKLIYMNKIIAISRGLLENY